MDFYDVVERRRSVRSFLPRPIGEEKLRRIMRAALLAPSARNRQRWRFILVRDPQTRRDLAQAAKGQDFVAQAPVVVVACGVDTDYVMTCGQPAYAIDVAIAVEHIALAAVVEGLGTCWIGAFHEDEVKRLLHIPDEVRVVALMPLGYPDEDPPPTSRAPYEDSVAWDTWPREWTWRDLA